MEINRVWAMPSRWTFQIKPIADLLNKYVGDGKGWIDPFAGMTSPAEITNDLNPDAKAKYHFKAEEFLTQLQGQVYNGVLFDPPYSLRQVKECYNEIGIENLTQEETNYFPSRERVLAGRLIKVDGYAISFGWSSQGIGKNHGFDVVEILLVWHGRGHNDTIVTVEKKIQGNLMEAVLNESAHISVHREPPSPERWKNRSRTFTGIAEAMAEQWCNLNV
jgi:hypothetical protein